MKNSTARNADLTTTTPTSAAERWPNATPARLESLVLAEQAGANENILNMLAAATKLARGEKINLPAGRYAHLSRGRDWCRKGRGDSAEWGDRRDDGGFRVGPGTWTVGSTDGFNRKDDTTWRVKHVKVGDAVWTIAD